MIESSRIKLTVDDINESLGPVCTQVDNPPKINTLCYLRSSTKMDAPLTLLLIDDPSPIENINSPLVSNAGQPLCTPKRSLRNDTLSDLNISDGTR